MAFFIETITARSDGVEVTERIRAKSEHSANLGAAYKFRQIAFGDFPARKCWCVDCALTAQNDFGEETIVYVNEYSDDARVKEGLEISTPTQ